jgi:hypothetical protein
MTLVSALVGVPGVFNELRMPHERIFDPAKTVTPVDGVSRPWWSREAASLTELASFTRHTPRREGPCP